MNQPVARALVGSPLYDVSPEHVAAVVALGVLVVGAWLFRHRLAPALPPIDRLLLALLAGSAAVHVGLAVGNVAHGVGTRVLFALAAVMLGVTARRVAAGRRAGRLGAAVLLGSIVAYWLAALGSEPPDQVGVVTKLGEILALAIVIRPTPSRRWRSAAGALAIALLVVATAASSWLGAFRASAAEPGVAAAPDAHGGVVPPPGSIHPVVPPRDPTPDERAAASDLLVATRTAVARYADPAAAAADGYGVERLSGIDFHASNPAYGGDGRILDPARPESLVYAVAPDGRPVLLGAVFQMPAIGAPGPAIGGPLTEWHAHENVCVSLTPPGLTGLLSPLGTCPVGSIAVPLSSEMIHVWIVPGAPEPFGDLDEAWKRAYLEAIAARP